jgi:glycosyltransferase involved in cell wall biosynthesis
MRELSVGIASEWVGERVGGLERQSTDLIESVIAEDHVNRYVIFVTARGAQSLRRLQGPRTRVHATAFNSRWYYVPVGLPLAVLRDRVDVLHAMFTVAPWCPARSIVLTVHDVCPDVHPDFFPPSIRARFRWLLLKGVARATRIIVPSELTRRELVQHYPVSPDKIVVVPDGVREGMPSDGDPGETPFDERAWPRDFALYVGRFHARKNIERLIDAFARSQARRNGLHLVLAGRDLWSGARIADHIRALGLEREVHCPGHVSDATLGELYKRARLFAFVSLHEGFGIPPVEAMAHGVPVLSSNVSAMPEILGDAAHYTSPYDVEEMAHAFDRVAQDQTLRAELVARGRQRAQVYAWPQLARRTMDVYRDAVAAS